MTGHDIIYSIDFEEVQKVANEKFGRGLTQSELDRLIRRCKEKFSSQIQRLIKKSIKEERISKKEPWRDFTRYEAKGDLR